MPVRSDLMPPFEVGVSADPGLALFDRVRLAMSGWGYGGRRADFPEILSLATQARIPAATDSCRLFRNRTCEDATKRHILEVTGRGQGETPTYPYPTFSGRLIVSPARPSLFLARNSGIVTMEAKLQLNVSRSLQAQRLAGSHKGVRKLPGFLLAISPQEDWTTEERVFTNDDNVILGRDRRHAFALLEPPERHLRDYCAAVSAVVGAVVEREGLQSWEPARFASLEQIEIYWEFEDRNPLFTLEQVALHLPSIARKMGVTKKYLDRGRFDLEGPSACHTVFLRGDTLLRVYAKTDWRLRFEVQFAREAVIRLVGSAGRMTFGELELACAKLRHTAAHELNRVLGMLWRRADLSGATATPEDLHRAFSARFPDATQAATLLAELCRFGRISPRPRDNTVYTGLRALVRDGVLTKEADSPGRRNFIAAQRFQMAWRQVALKPSNPPFRPRKAPMAVLAMRSRRSS